MNYWLVKSEPGEYSWDDLVKEKTGCWDGVRNYAARNNLRGMKKGDQVLFYHSVTGKEIVGIAEVVREAYPDPTTDDDRWSAVDLKPVKKLKKALPLSEIKADKKLQDLMLVKIGRLSVMPVKKSEFDHILKRGEV